MMRMTPLVVEDKPLDVAARLAELTGLVTDAAGDGLPAHELECRPWQYLIPLFGLLCLIASLATVVRASDASDASDDKTLSPYFLITTPDTEVDQFALKGTRAEVNIAGVIADVKVTQVYQNHGQKPLEAIYVFPASTRAAVYGMKMTIGERTIVAKIDKREQARADYEQAKAQGRSASLLEQQRPNVFQMNVANLLPGDEIKVEMRYTELLTPRQRLYEFVYPTVVGPRYSNQPAATAPASDRWVQNPYLRPGEQGAKLPYRFDLRLTLNAGPPIQDIASPSHKVTIAYAGPAQATITLDPAETDGGNRDFIAKYRLAGNQVESGLLLYRGEEENFFLLMMQPPAQVATAQIPPREYLFVVDVSGSMRGFPLDLSKKLLQDLIGHLGPTDWFNLLLFAGQSVVLAERSLPATPDNLQRALDLLDRQQGGGGTELLPALRHALQLPRPDGVSRTVIIATDGYVDVEKETFEVIRNHLGEANLFAFGIGSSVNRFLIEGLARAGMGEPFVVTQPAQAAAKATEFRQLIQTPVLTDIKVQYDDFEAYAADPPQIPDVFVERPVVVVGKWRGEPKGELAVSGARGGQPYRQAFQVAEVQPSPANAALRYLWARSRIAWLDDNNRLEKSDRRVREVTDLGLKYSLLTAYTSFVAIDSKVRLKDGQATTVEQPLPLPERVSEFAVKSGGLVGSPAGIAGQMFMFETILKPQPPDPVTPASTQPAARSWKLAKVTVLNGTISKKTIQATFDHDQTIRRCIVPEDAHSPLRRHLTSLFDPKPKYFLWGPPLAGPINQKPIGRQYQNNLQKNKYLYSDPRLDQQLILTLTINAQGKVTEVKPADSGLNAEPWIQCVVAAIKAWPWQRTVGRRAAQIRLELEVGM